MSHRPVRVLFLCDDSSSRSQIAEAWLRHLGGDRFISRSAGIEPRHLHPLATRAMQEVGVNIARQRGKAVEAVVRERFDVVITLSDGVRGAVDRVAGPFSHEHEDFTDPSWLEEEDGGDLEQFHSVRDALRAFVEALIARYA